MGWNEAWGVLGCVLAGAGIGVGIVLTAGALAAPCGAAKWAVTVVEGTTALTAAGCTALAGAGAAGAAVGVAFGTPPTSHPITPTGRRSERRDVVRVSSGMSGPCFVFKKAAKWRRELRLAPSSSRRHRQGPRRQTTVHQNCANLMLATNRFLITYMCTLFYCRATPS